MSTSEEDIKTKSENGLRDSTGWGAYLVVAICGTGLPLLDLVFGQLTTSFNDFATQKITGDMFMDKVIETTLILVYILAAKFVLFYFGMMAVSSASTKTTAALRLAFVNKILRHEIAYFDQNDPSTVAVQITNNGNLVQQGIAEKLALIIQALSALITAFIIALYAQWKLALITMCIIPAIVITTAIAVIVDMRQESRVLRIYASASEIAAEALSQIKMVHALWGQPRVMEKYSSVLNEAHREGMKKSVNYGFLFSSEFFLVLSGYALAFWQGIRMYSSGEISEPGDIIVVIFAVLVAATSMTQVAPQISILSKAASAAENMLKVIDRESMLDPLDTRGNKLSCLKGEIHLNQVFFAYPSRPDIPVLHDLTLHIPAGKTTAIIGTSGSGKSTIVGLMERWYDCSAGSVSLDGNDVKSLNTKWLRSQIGLVQQEPVLFSGTIFENVREGLKDLDETSHERQFELVQEACHAANADDFIRKLPEGYRTNVGQGGGLLSGGQKQRIAIARTIISNPKILLLDEATSALDPVAEGKVQEALDAVRKSRTTVVIAHKLSTIKDSDNIVVLDKGALLEQGTHKELLKAEGAYFRLVMAQDLGSESDDAESEGTLLKAIQSTTRTDFPAQKEREYIEETGQSHQTVGYGIFHCIWKFVFEQGSDWMWLSLIFLGCAIGGLTYPALAILISRLIGVFQLQGPELISQSSFFSLMLFIVALCNLFSYFAMGYASNVVGQNITRRYRNIMLSHLIYQDVSFFDSAENTTGKLVSRLATAPAKVQELLGFNVSIMLVTVINLISTCIVALIFGWKLALVVIAGLLIPLILAAFARYYSESRLEAEMEHRFASGASVAAEGISAIRTVAALGLESRIISRYEESLKSVINGSIRKFYIINCFFALAQAVEFGAVALAFWYGATLLVKGEYTVQQFYVVLLASVFSGEACLQFVTFTTSLSQAKSGGNYILWLSQQNPIITEHETTDGHRLDEERKSIATFTTENLEFSYSGRYSAPVIRGVDLQIQVGEFVAFVGASGCGKSTMVSLIERFYDVTNGSICYLGNDIRSLCPRLYRQNLAFVQQEPVLMSGTIRDNVAFGAKETMTDDQIMEACRQANIRDFVLSLPNGLNTSCGSRGTQLSGGQRQRIAIARALARQPDVLLLDEATSALDTESERVVQAAVDSASMGRTTIAIAHRLSTIKHANRIYVFHRGRIAEVGNHTQLLEQRGIYHRMCLSQSLR